MNHKAIVQAESERPYSNRNYVLHELDERHFTALNQSPAKQNEHGHWVELAPAAVIFINGYCLDALDESPAGAMQRGMPGSRRGFQLYTVRGLTLQDLEDRAELAEKLIAEILAEQRQTKGVDAPE